MHIISVAERTGEGFCELLSRHIEKAGIPVKIYSGVRPDCDLLVCSPAAVVRSTARFRTVLTPGGNACPASDEAVSYGPSPRDSLTVSSITPASLVISIQRELLSLNHTTIERQELPHIPITRSSDTTLAVAGALLLLGLPPEALPNTL